MKSRFNKTLFSYTVGIFLVIALTGIVISQVVTNIYVLLAVLLIEFIVLILTVFYMFDKYIKPIDKAAETMDKLLKGNYRTRISQPMNGMIGELNRKINALARKIGRASCRERV